MRIDWTTNAVCMRSEQIFKGNKQMGYKMIKLWCHNFWQIIETKKLRVKEEGTIK